MCAKPNELGKGIAMNISIVGAGNIAEKMAQTVNMMQNVKLYAIASRSKEKAESFAEKYDIPKAYGSYAELAEDSDAGLIYVATPHTFHYEISKMFIEHKHPVLCEKPITVNEEEAERLFKAAEENGVFITEALWTRFMPVVDKVRGFMEMIGTPRFMESSFGIDVIGRERLHNPQLAGGALLDLGIYPITAAFMLFGSDFSDVWSDAVFTDNGLDAENYITLTYPDKKHAYLMSSMNVKTECRTRICGSRGYIEIDGPSGWDCVRVYDTSDKLIEKYRLERLTGYEYEVESAVRAISAGKMECKEITHAETLKVMRFMDSLREKWGLKYPFEV